MFIINTNQVFDKQDIYIGAITHKAFNLFISEESILHFVKKNLFLKEGCLKLIYNGISLILMEEEASFY